MQHLDVRVKEAPTAIARQNVLESGVVPFYAFYTLQHNPSVEDARGIFPNVAIVAGYTAKH